MPASQKGYILMFGMWEETHAVIIGNPNSGRASNRERLERCAAILRSGGLEVEVLNTAYPDHATELAASAGERLVIAAGGDGTVNEVINGLSKGATLGVLPLGTANVLARELGLPLHLEGACERLLRGESTRMDLGVARRERDGAERRFSCMAGIGFDAKVVRAVTPTLKTYLRGLAFPLMAFKVLFRDSFPPVNVSGGGEAPRVVPFAIVANAHHYGGDYRLSEPGLLTSGKLEVVLIKRVSLLLRPDIFASIMARRPLDRSMESFSAKAVLAETSGEAAVPVQLDGELWGDLPMSFRIEPAALRVIR